MRFCRACFLLIPAFVALPLAAQNDTLREATPYSQPIEDLILNAELDGQVDYSFVTDFLEELLRHPLDVNTVTRDEFLQLPGMTDLLYNNLRAYVDTFGNLTSLYELQAVRGFREEHIRNILPYLTTDAARARDISPGKLHPAGPTPREVWENMVWEFTQRAVWEVENAKGYTPADTSYRDLYDDQGNLIGTEPVLSTRYAGDKYRHYSRLRARMGQHISLALTGEKDPGEVFEWNPLLNRYGYDFLSGHVALQNYGSLKRLIVGDYNLQAGQGLVMSRGLGFGKGASTIAGTKMPNLGLLPYASVNENQFLRGAAATVALRNWYFTGFFSRTRQDASVSARDSLTADVLQASSLQISGLHRTVTELANRRAVDEQMYGGRIEYKTATLTLGTTHYRQVFGAPVSPALNEYNQFDFRGDQNYVNGLDWDWIYRNLNVFGEVARSRSGGLGGVMGLMASLSPTVDASMVIRHFDKDFHSNKAYVFSERPLAPQNETGVYLGLRIAPSPKWELNSYFDQYYTPWLKFRTGYPAAGWEWMAQLDYKPRRGTLVYLRYRTDHREQNSDDYPAGQQLRFLVPVARHQFRLHFETKVDRDIIYRSRMEFSWYQEGAEDWQRGFLLYQDIAWRIGFKYRLTGRLAVFDARDYNARIYAYENDILGFFSIPPYYGVGTRYYLIVDWKPVDGLEFWARVAQTRLHETRSFGSGLEETQGDLRTEIKLQLRWTFGGGS